MADDRRDSLKWQRYEAKYLISPTQAAEVRRYCLNHLPFDNYAMGCDGNEYPILSTYLDSASRQLLRHTIDKRRKRYKLRVRTYRRYNEAANGEPVFCEIKRKTAGTVHKTRARVEPGLTESLLWGHDGLLSEEVACDEGTRKNVNEFLQLREQIGAAPIVGIAYMREAYEANGSHGVRVTLDRDVHFGTLASPADGGGEMWWPKDVGGVVLEVKFTNTYPEWVMDMLRRIEVLRRGVCKYVICCQAAGVGSGTVLV